MIGGKSAASGSRQWGCIASTMYLLSFKLSSLTNLNARRFAFEMQQMEFKRGICDIRWGWNSSIFFEVGH